MAAARQLLLANGGARPALETIMKKPPGDEPSG
jgi:hypothetical protein